MSPATQTTKSRSQPSHAVPLTITPMHTSPRTRPAWNGKGHLTKAQRAQMKQAQDSDRSGSRPAEHPTNRDDVLTGRSITGPARNAYEAALIETDDPADRAHGTLTDARGAYDLGSDDDRSGRLLPAAVRGGGPNRLLPGARPRRYPPALMRTVVIPGRVRFGERQPDRLVRISDDSAADGLHKRQRAIARWVGDPGIAYQETVGTASRRAFEMCLQVHGGKSGAEKILARATRGGDDRPRPDLEREADRILQTARE